MIFGKKAPPEEPSSTPGGGVKDNYIGDGLLRPIKNVSFDGFLGGFTVREFLEKNNFRLGGEKILREQSQTFLDQYGEVKLADLEAGEMDVWEVVSGGSNAKIKKFIDAVNGANPDTSTAANLVLGRFFKSILDAANLSRLLDRAVMDGMSNIFPAISPVEQDPTQNPYAATYAYTGHEGGIVLSAFPYTRFATYSPHTRVWAGKIREVPKSEPARV